MISLLVSIFIGWLLLRWLWPRAPIYVEPPAPQLVIHLHQPQILVTFCERGPSGLGTPGQ
jgi:hypothetical protein